MSNPERRLIVDIAQAINRHAPSTARSADELLSWARRRYDQGLLLLDEDGRPVPLSPTQITRATAYAAKMRGV